MNKRREADDLASRISAKLALYSRDAGSYLLNRKRRARMDLMGAGVLGSVIPLALATGAQSQCLGTAVFDVYASYGVTNTSTFTFGSGLSLQFRYRGGLGGGPVLMAVVSGIVEAGAGSGSIIKRSYSWPDTAPVLGNTGFGMLAQQGATPFGQFQTAGGHVVIQANGIPGWLELSQVGRIATGHVRLQILEGGLEEDGDGFIHVGDCSSLELNLPVELTSFDALVHESTVRLAWETATELNNAGFEVQRESPDHTFRKIGFVEGSGTTTHPNRYRFIDEDVAPNVHYRYRLKQIDLDGSSSFSEVVEVFTEDPSQVALGSFYPNPTDGGIASLDINVADATEATVSIYDVRGALIESSVEMLSAGANRLDFGTERFSSGPHFAKVQVGERIQYRQFTVAR